MSLQVFTGPMYSSKTRAMIGEISKLSDISFNKKVLIINHQLDNRNVNDVISSHSSIYKGLSEHIHTISNAQLSSVDVSCYTIIGIDESCFFEEDDLVDTIKLWINQGKHIICSGLDGDVNMNQFGFISKLLPIADRFIKLNAVCTLCNQELTDRGEEITPMNITRAPFTKKITPNTSLIDIGGKDKYIAVCRKHA